jgi:hypothetical protein
MGQPPPLITLLMRLTAQRSNPRARPTRGKKGREPLCIGAPCPGKGKMVKVRNAVINPRSMCVFWGPNLEFEARPTDKERGRRGDAEK